MFKVLSPPAPAPAVMETELITNYTLLCHWTTLPARVPLLKGCIVFHWISTLGFLYPFFCSGHIGSFCILTVVKYVIMNTRGQVFLLFSIYIYSSCLCVGMHLPLNLWRSEGTVGELVISYTPHGAWGLDSGCQACGQAPSLLAISLAESWFSFPCGFHPLWLYSQKRNHWITSWLCPVILEDAIAFHMAMLTCRPVNSLWWPHITTTTCDILFLILLQDH